MTLQRRGLQWSEIVSYGNQRISAPSDSFSLPVEIVALMQYGSSFQILVLADEWMISDQRPQQLYLYWLLSTFSTTATYCNLCRHGSGWRLFHVSVSMPHYDGSLVCKQDITHTALCVCPLTAAGQTNRKQSLCVRLESLGRNTKLTTCKSCSNMKSCELSGLTTDVIYVTW